MTLIDVLPEGDLYFYHSEHCGDVWVVSGAHSVIVAYREDEIDIARVRRKVELWDRARQDPLKTHVINGFEGAVYAATEDLSTKRISVAWFSPGDWLGVPGVSSRKPQLTQLSLHWPETYRYRLRQLAREQEKRKERREALNRAGIIGERLM